MKLKHKVVAVLSRLFFLVLTVNILLIACSKETTQKDEGLADHEEHQEQIVQLSDQQLEEFGIELGVVGPDKLHIEKELSGEIVIEPDRLAHIVPRFPGIVKEVWKHIGDKVKKGEVLAIIESNESLSNYEVKSLIAGTVTDKHLTLGEVIIDESHAFTITDLSSVWANLSVYQKDLPYIKIGQKVIISAGSDSPETTGKISYISPLLDEATRTATARVVLSNPEGHWRPGLFITGHVEIDAEEVDIVIPKTALENIGDQKVVFIQTPAGFVAQPVTLGKSSRTHVEVRSGISHGQKFVVKGGFTLKAELAKSSFGDEH